jgi:hypothetical protein
VLKRRADLTPERSKKLLAEGGERIAVIPHDHERTDRLPIVYHRQHREVGERASGFAERVWPVARHGR